MKKLLLVTLMIVMVTGLIFSSCDTEEAITETATTTATATETVTTTVKPVKLRLADFQPPEATQAKMLKWWGDEITRRTNGNVSFEYLWAQSACTMQEQTSLMSSGVIDVTMVLAFFDPSSFPINSVQRIPGSATDKTLNSNYACDMLMRTPEANAELTDHNIKLMFGAGHSGDYIFSDREIKSVEDMKGLRVASQGLYNAAFKAWGCEVEEMGSIEVYEAARRDMIDAFNKPLFQGITLNLYEVTPYMSIPKIGFTVGAFGMNLDTWNSLSPDAQNAIEEVNSTMYVKSCEIFTADDAVWLALMDRPETKIYKVEWDPAEVQKRYELSAFLWDDWAEGLNQRGLPGTRLKDQYLQWQRQGPP